MLVPARKVPVFEPMRMAKGTRCPYALASNTIPFHASASKAPICTSEKSCATCAGSDNGRSRARKIAGCSHRAPRRRTRCLYRRSPVPSWLLARVIARERLPVGLLASFICGSAHFGEGELMNEITTVGADLAKEVIVVCAGGAQGRPVYFKEFSLAGFAEWAAKLSPCTFGMEGCSSAHHGTRFLSERGPRAGIHGADA